mmetsp:Transcript_3727/g.9312  ORF Transcript_3727/g.9312 Transcript_3727/m.9312 type:complete len:311 (+) Transcript_3727:509-1441(+)
MRPRQADDTGCIANSGMAPNVWLHMEHQVRCDLVAPYAAAGGVGRVVPHPVLGHKLVAGVGGALGRHQGVIVAEEALLPVSHWADARMAHVLVVVRVGRAREPGGRGVGKARQAAKVFGGVDPGGAKDELEQARPHVARHGAHGAPGRLPPVREEQRHGGVGVGREDGVEGVQEGLRVGGQHVGEQAALDPGGRVEPRVSVVAHGGEVGDAPVLVAWQRHKGAHEVHALALGVHAVVQPLAGDATRARGEVRGEGGGDGLDPGPVEQHVGGEGSLISGVGGWCHRQGEGPAHQLGRRSVRLEHHAHHHTE